MLLCGSFARKTGDRFSDIDILAIVEGGPVRSERTWPVPISGAGTFHVSIGAETLASFEDEGEDVESASWALGFAVLDSMTLLWSTPLARRVIGPSPSERLPAAPPQLEDFAELFMKVRRARASDDRILLRWAARMLAEYSAGLLSPYNPPVEVSSPADALRAALALAEAPETYASDFEICAGLTAAPDQDVFESAVRLQETLLEWLRVRLEGEALDPDDVRALLVDGSLQAYLRS